MNQDIGSIDLGAARLCVTVDRENSHPLQPAISKSWPNVFLFGKVTLVEPRVGADTLFDSEENEENLLIYLSTLRHALMETKEGAREFRSLSSGDLGGIYCEMINGDRQVVEARSLEDLVAYNCSWVVTPDDGYRLALFLYSINGTGFWEIAALYDKDESTTERVSGQHGEFNIETSLKSLELLASRIEGGFS